MDLLEGTGLELVRPVVVLVFEDSEEELLDWTWFLSQR
jgi:hypothetical protein